MYKTHFTAFGFTVLLATACGGSPTPSAKTADPTAAPVSSGPAGAKSIKLFKDDPGKPGREASNFAQGDKGWHFEVALDKIVTNSKMRLDLIGTMTSVYKDKKLGSIEGTLLAANNLTFKVPIENKMPIGQFKGEVYLGDAKIKDFTFAVEPDGGNTEISYGSVRLLRDNGKDAPGDVVKEFKPSDRHVFFEVDSKGANARVVNVKWVHMAFGIDGKSVPVADVTREMVIDNSIIEGDIALPRNWPVARYQSELFVDGKSAKRFDWGVKSGATAANVPAKAGTFAALKLITAKNGMIQLTAPNDWGVTDTSDAERAKLDFLAPDNTGFMAVNAFELGPKQSGAQFLAEQLDKHVNSRYGDDKTYQSEAAIPQNDGSALKPFALDVKLTDGKLHRMNGIGTARQTGKMLVFKRVLVEKDALAVNKDTINKMIEFAQVAGGAAPAQQTNAGPLVIENLKTFTHKTGAFSMDVPAAWTLQDRS